MSRGNRAFDPQSILDEDERVPVEFLTAAYRLGHLDESSGMVVRRAHASVCVPPAPAPAPYRFRRAPSTHSPAGH